MASTGEVLADRYDPRANGIGFLRLFFALAVVVDHSLPAGGFGPSIGRADNNAGTLAVEGFFALSGFLIAGSAIRAGSLPVFLLQRGLRIFPAFWVALAVVAFGFAPLAAWVGGGHFTPVDAVGYVVNNFGLWVRQVGIGDTLAGGPYPDVWNQPLWTLFYEFKCYLLIGVLMATRGLTNPRVLGVLVGALWIYLQFGVDVGVTADDRPARFVFTFLVGSLMCVLADRVPTRPVVPAVAAALALVTYAFGGFEVVGLGAFAYLCVWGGAVIPFRRVGVDRDFSYGVYIYAWPVQQVLALTIGQAWGFVGYVIATLVLAAPLAAASWYAVERPALRLKRRLASPGHPTLVTKYRAFTVAEPLDR